MLRRESRSTMSTMSAELPTSPRLLPCQQRARTLVLVGALLVLLTIAIHASAGGTPLRPEVVTADTAQSNLLHKAAVATLQGAPSIGVNDTVEQRNKRRLHRSIQELRRALLDASSHDLRYADGALTKLQSRLTASPLLSDGMPAEPAAVAGVERSDDVATTGAVFDHLPSDYDARIDRTFREYAELHARILNADGTVPVRFVTWGIDRHPLAGWGNRMIGFVSAIAFAMMSGRAFVWDEPRDNLLSGSIESVPLEDGGIDWSFRRAQEAHSRASPQAQWSTRVLDVGVFMPDDASCNDVVAEWRDITTIEVDSMGYFLPMLTHNPHYREWFLQHLGEPLTFFRHVMQRFVRMRPHLRSKYDEFVRDVLRPQWYTRVLQAEQQAEGQPVAVSRKRRYVIGLQIRTGHLVRAAHEERVFHSCAKSVAAQALAQPALMHQLAPRGSITAGPSKPVHVAAPVAPPGRSTSRRPKEQVELLQLALDALERALVGRHRHALRSDVDGEAVSGAPGGAGSGTRRVQQVAFSAADAVVGGTGGARRRMLQAMALAQQDGDAPVELDVVFFIATDSADVRQRARDALGHDRVITIDGVDGTDAAVLDNLMLAACDDVVITWPKSTFGVIGGALTVSGRPPVTVMSGSKRAHECVRQLTTEPCFHGWYYRFVVPCYNRRFETYEMLNHDNCYFCFRDGDCPASDQADAFLRPSMPLEYEALLEVADDNPGRFVLPDGASISQLKAQYRGTYDAWRQQHADLDA